MNLRCDQLPSLGWEGRSPESCPFEPSDVESLVLAHHITRLWQHNVGKKLYSARVCRLFDMRWLLAVFLSSQKQIALRSFASEQSPRLFPPWFGITGKRERGNIPCGIG
jgi:hypothetical protein